MGNTEEEPKPCSVNAKTDIILYFLVRRKISLSFKPVKSRC